jgi:transketolase
VSAPDISPQSMEQLSTTARQIRQDILRITYSSGNGHASSSLSLADLVTALLFHELRIDPEHPEWPERDRLVLSEGHSAAALYAALAHRGFLDRAVLPTLKPIGSPLQSHPDHRTVSAVEVSTGAPGQGLGMAIGMALDARLAKRPSRVYAIVGDDECRAGLTWEALLAGGDFALDNLVVLIDRSGRNTEDAKAGLARLEPLADKLRAFHYETFEIDGHDFQAIFEALARARATKGGPTAIIAATVPGKGVSFMENQPAWTGKPLNREETERGLAELGGSL